VYLLKIVVLSCKCLTRDCDNTNRTLVHWVRHYQFRRRISQSDTLRAWQRECRRWVHCGRVRNSGRSATNEDPGENHQHHRQNRTPRGEARDRDQRSFGRSNKRLGFSNGTVRSVSGGHILVKIPECRRPKTLRSPGKRSN
jgi:hypothetical protein